MEKNDIDITNYNHEINLSERSKLNVTGVKKIENFDDQEFIMETTMGLLTIKGENLELVKLDTIQGNVSIKGDINSLEYKELEKQKDSHGIINRLFK